MEGGYYRNGGGGEREGRQGRGEKGRGE